MCLSFAFFFGEGICECLGLLDNSLVGWIEADRLNIVGKYVINRHDSLDVEVFLIACEFNILVGRNKPMRVDLQPLNCHVHMLGRFLYGNGILHLLNLDFLNDLHLLVVNQLVPSIRVYIGVENQQRVQILEVVWDVS